MNKLLMVAMFAIAVLALFGAGAVVLSGETVSVETQTAGSGDAWLCDAGSPGCPPDPDNKP